MKRTVLVFGSISGAILVIYLAIAMPLVANGTIPFEHSEVVGYTSMVAAFLFVFFGIRSYRDHVAEGTITFGKAFQVGILITLIASVFYVVAWLIYFYTFAPDFFETYASFVVGKMEAEGAAASEIAATREQMARFGEMYRNPLVNAAFTFIEPLPVGLLVTLVSAAILRRKPGGGATPD